MPVGMEMVERIRRHLERNGAAKTELAGLLASWDIDVADREGRRELTDALASGGVSVTPPLEDVEDPAAEIVLRLGDPAELSAARPPRPAPPAPPEPQARAAEPPAAAPEPEPGPRAAEPPAAAREPEPEPRAAEPPAGPAGPPPARAADPSRPRTPPPARPRGPELPRASVPEPPPARPAEPPAPPAEPPPARPAEPPAPPAEPAARAPRDDGPPASEEEGSGAKEQAGAALRGIGRGAGALWSRGAGALRRDDEPAEPGEGDTPPAVDAAPAAPAPREPEPEPPSRWAEERRAAAAQEAEAARERPPAPADAPPGGRRSGGLWARTGLTGREPEQPTDEEDSLAGAGTRVEPEPARPAEHAPPPPPAPKEKLFVASELGRDLIRTSIPMLAVGAALVMISLILPWYEAVGGTLASGDERLDISLGWEWLEILDIHLMLLAFAAIGVAMLVFQRQPRPAALFGRVVLVLGLAAIVAVMVRMRNPPFDTLNGFTLEVETQIGPFVALVGVVLTTIGALSPAQIGIERLLGGGEPVSFADPDGLETGTAQDGPAGARRQPQRR